MSWGWFSLGWEAGPCRANRTKEVPVASQTCKQVLIITNPSECSPIPDQPHDVLLQPCLYSGLLLLSQISECQHYSPLGRV